MILDPTTPGKHINRRILLSLHQDGLLDILAGLIIITFGIIPLLDASGLGAGWRQVIFLSLYGLEVAGVLILKKKITQPRAGLVVISGKMQRKIGLILLVLNLLIFLFFVVNYLFDLNIGKQLGQYQLSILLGLVFLMMLTVTGIMIKAFRFSVYGLLVLVSYLASEHLFLAGKIPHHGIPLASMISGGIIVLSGILLLYKFLGRYKLEN